MGFLDDVKKKANKENLNKLKDQVESKIDEAQDKLGTSGKKKEEAGEGEQKPAGEGGQG